MQHLAACEEIRKKLTEEQLFEIDAQKNPTVLKSNTQLTLDKIEAKENLKKLKQCTFSDYSIIKDSMTGEEQLKLDEALTKFIFCSNLPPYILENEKFREFISLLRPRYKLPSRGKLKKF